MGAHENNTTKFTIVEAAIDLYREQGVDPVTVKAVCDKAHVTRNAFYYYFKTREALFDAVGDYLTLRAKEQVSVNFTESPYFSQIWAVYKPFLEYQLYLGPDIMNHCCFSRTGKGRPDNYMYVDEDTAYTLRQLIDLAKKHKEIGTTAPSEDLVWQSYAIIRGNNVKWCFRYGESDLLGDARNALNTLFLPRKELAL